MTDREKVIKGLGCLCGNDNKPDNCPCEWQLGEHVCDWNVAEAAIELLKEQPEIVRCKDCKHYRYYGLHKWTISDCEINHVENQPEDWFCADGKRR